MPRRYREPKVRREPSIELLDFLLGLCPTPSELAARGISETYDGFASFALDTMSVEDFMELWTAHEPAIRAHAEELGLPVPDPREYRPFPHGFWVDYSR
jgi:hypothetical protein